MSDDESFLARWSQRKREALREAAAPEPVVPAEEEPSVDLKSLPKLEDLTGASDITAFLQKGIPDALRNAALRRAWALDPSVRDYVGDALDYAWDWNVPGGVPGSGEMTVGTDVAKMVSQIFGDSPKVPEPSESPDGEKVIAYGATQEEVARSPVAWDQASLSQEETQPPSLSGQEEPANPEVKPVAELAQSSAAPQQKLARHGSALPR
ncbi:MAG: hypothetical protein JWL62_1292 [Hyphomicrobiales bacterium]|nr:hypothetical protein [Hyphomicrobiales bacterium]